MPKAKRAKVVSLTQTKKKTKDFKTRIVDRMHDYIKKYEFVYAISFQNMRTNSFRVLQQELKDSKYLIKLNQIRAWKEQSDANSIWKDS